jgi:hypothetical protein
MYEGRYKGTEKEQKYARDWYWKNRDKILAKIKERRQERLEEFREKGREQAQRFRSETRRRE